MTSVSGMAASGLAATCPNCKSVPTRVYVRSNERDVLSCSGCGLLYSSPRPTTATIASYFNKEYIPDEHRAVHELTEPRAKTLHTEAALIRRLLPNGGRLLDVGCASGAFLLEFSRDPAWTVSGVEPSKVASALARSRFGLNVHTGLLRDQRLESSAYDVVTSLDAFYFHPEPNDDLQEISRILRPGGYLAIEIPGLRFRLLKNTGLVCRLMYGEPARLNAQLHLYFYSARTLTRLVGRHGFVLAHRFPQQGPIYGSRTLRLLNGLYYGLSSWAYRLTNGQCNIVPKELLIFRHMAANTKGP